MSQLVNLITPLKQVLKKIQSSESIDDNVFITPAVALIIKRFLGAKNLEINNSYFDQMNSTERSGHTYTSIHQISNRGDVEKVTRNLTQTILGHTKKQDDAIQKDLKDCLNYVISELLNNVADHSNSHGWTMAQYYPTTRRVDFCVIDSGCGFLHRICQKFSDIHSEAQAMYHAIKKGVTASMHRVYGGERNAGYGLYIISSLAKQIRDTHLLIASNQQTIYFNGNQWNDKTLNASIEGSLVCFSFSMEALAEIDRDIEVLINSARLDDEELMEDLEIF